MGLWRMILMINPQTLKNTKQKARILQQNAGFLLLELFYN
jgi:hypothetical protein